MAKNEKRLIVSLAIIFAMYSVIVFGVPFTKNGLFFISYLLTVVAIAIQYYTIKTALIDNKDVKSKFYGFPIAKISVIYLVAQLALSLIFMALAKICPMWIAIIVYVLLLGLSALGFIAADVTREEITRQDDKLQHVTECMTELRSIVYPLSGQVDDEACKKMLSDLADEFKYSDPVSSESLAEIEAELKSLVAELQQAIVDGETTAITELGKKVKVALVERNRLCKIYKKR